MYYRRNADRHLRETQREGNHHEYVLAQMRAGKISRASAARDALHAARDWYLTLGWDEESANQATIQPRRGHLTTLHTQAVHPHKGSLVSLGEDLNQLLRGLHNIAAGGSGEIYKVFPVQIKLQHVLHPWEDVGLMDFVFTRESLELPPEIPFDPEAERQARSRFRGALEMMVIVEDIFNDASPHQLQQVNQHIDAILEAIETIQQASDAILESRRSGGAQQVNKLLVKRLLSDRHIDRAVRAYHELNPPGYNYRRNPRYRRNADDEYRTAYRRYSESGALQDYVALVKASLRTGQEIPRPPLERWLAIVNAWEYSTWDAVVEAGYSSKADASDPELITPLEARMIQNLDYYGKPVKQIHARMLAQDEHYQIDPEVGVEYAVHLDGPEGSETREFDTLEEAAQYVSDRLRDRLQTRVHGISFRTDYVNYTLEGFTFHDVENANIENNVFLQLDYHPDGDYWS